MTTSDTKEKTERVEEVVEGGNNVDYFMCKVEVLFLNKLDIVLVT